jgi:Rhodopirellula transposase DDE domain
MNNETMKKIVSETGAELSGYQRRHFMAKVVKELYENNVRQAARELGWNRAPLRKALAEWEGQFCYIDRYHERGRQAAEAHLPRLLEDIRQIADSASQTDATFQTTQLYTRLSAAEVRKQLIEQKGYTTEALPSVETIRRKLNQLGYQLKAVKKNQPLKKIPQTDAIFAQLHQVNQAADADERVLRISWDAKAPVLIGRFARAGLSRLVVKAWDHDFQTNAKKVTPFGLYLPKSGELYLYFTQSKVTSDFIIDCLHDFWLTQGQRFPNVRTLVINQDNGPENHTRRTQFMARLAAFVDHFQLAVQLACYPPYHSKYNPIERIWGALEKHWNGSLLDALQTVLNFARSLTYKSRQPVVELVTKTYQTGVKLSQKLMAALEQERLKRLTSLEKWFVYISPIFITKLA